MDIKLFLYLSFFVIFYAYFGYALVALLLILIRKENKTTYSNDFELKSITLIIAAYNEENFIEEKINNSLALRYDKNKLKIYIVTDGSSDQTATIVAKYPEITHFHEAKRGGKIAAVDRVMKHVNTEIVVFSDANTLINPDGLMEIMKHYANPEIGGVAGEKRILTETKDDLAGKGEGFYWKYESMLKKIDSRFYSVVGAAGELFSLRSNLYQHPGDNVLLDDFIISLNVCMKGYKIAYEPNAYALENPSFSLKEEQKRKIRISAGGFQSIFMLKELLKFWKYPKLSFLYISHRVLRWAICPFLLPLILILNVLQLITDYDIFFLITVLLQVTLYLFAISGFLLAKFNIKIKLFQFAFYFVFMNIMLYLGFYKFLKGNQSVLWDKAKRK
jgi:cellulose synthase/poly-beta-1,6-N-acetylglucosamine synthase-like glycosyltransferase